MREQLVSELERAVDSFANDANGLDSESLARVAERVANVFDVKPDEVAVLKLIGSNKFLQFLIPEKLQAVGTIPMTSTTALAVRTARDRRPEIVNNFAASRHASVFEGVPLGRRHGEAIHKIMSAPIILEDKVLGVVQISRKGHSAGEAGPDFTPQDLRQLVGVTPILGRLVQRCQVS